MQRTLLFAIAAGAAVVTAGCTNTYRMVTAEHWHDPDTLVIAYTVQVRRDSLFVSTEQSKAHVLICRIGPKNSIACRPAPEIDRALAAPPERSSAR